ncbi:DEKNAAC104571 [Brettanomyces naardenensis]|uniref:DEKNAAC104571 n=1 Tax=Brettanomyces naardenensis TaxID=13370 RepID=A0A448YQY4_BRENA|nr:DEKNAAC104571 [Brettanomyces naardenensis]
MLQSRNLSKVLIQLLQPTPEVSSSIPISISLLSLETGQPLITCISQLYKQKGKHSQGSGEQDVSETNGTLGVDALNTDSDITNGTLSETAPTQQEDLNEDILENEPGKRLQQLQRKIDYLETNFDSNYIDANLDPSDNLNIISILSLREYNERKLSGVPCADDPWMVLACNDCTSFLYKVNDQYMVLLCCDPKYPKGFAIKRLEKLCKYLNSHM